MPCAVVLARGSRFWVQRRGPPSLLVCPGGDGPCLVTGVWSGLAGLVSLTLPAEVDISNAGEVSRDLDAVVAQHAALVIADMTATTFCDSAGVTALVRAVRQANASGTGLRVAAAAPAVTRVLAITRVDRLIEIHPSVAAALRRPGERRGRPGPRRPPGRRRAGRPRRAGARQARRAGLAARLSVLEGRHRGPVRPVRTGPAGPGGPGLKLPHRVVPSVMDARQLHDLGQQLRVDAVHATAAAGSGHPAVTGISASAYVIPTDALEADGTLTWDATTMVLATARADGMTGTGWSYAAAAAGQVITDVLAGAVTGRSALDVPGACEAMIRAVRNIGRPGIAATAISAVDIALWDLKARLLGCPLASLLGQARASVPIYGSGGFTSYDAGRPAISSPGGWSGTAFRG